MNALPVVRCAGAPRDLGFDQGVALAPRIAHEAFGVTPRGQPARWLIECARTSSVSRVQRDTRRYFPHLAERAQGLARGGGVSEYAIAALLSHSPRAAQGPQRALTNGSASALLLRAIDAPLDALLLRHSAPQVGYLSVEVALAWRVAALVGVNECGLALSATAAPAGQRPPTDGRALTEPAPPMPAAGHASARDDENNVAAFTAAAAAPAPTDGRAAARVRAPAALLVQDCLQRFDTVAKALEWLERRPSAGDACFVLADAGGARAVARLSGAACRVSAPDDAGPDAVAADALSESLAATLRAEPAAASDAAALSRALRLAGGGAPVQVLADAARRRIGVLLPNAALCWHAVGGR